MGLPVTSECRFGVDGCGTMGLPGTSECRFGFDGCGTVSWSDIWTIFVGITGVSVRRPD